MSKAKHEKRIRELRVRFGTLSALLLVSACALCLVAVVLATRFATRVDVTATRQHKLSPRTLAVLGSLKDAHEILIVVDRAQVEPLIWQRIDDVLEELDRASENLRITVIDTGNAADRANVPGVFDRLAALYADQLAEHVRTIRGAAEATVSLTARMGQLDERLQEAAGLMDAELPQHQTLVEQAARARVLVGELQQRGNASLGYLEQRVGSAELPAVDQASAEIASLLASLATDQSVLADALEQFGRALEELDDEAAAPVLGAVELLRGIRDVAARHADAIERLGPLRLLTIARLLEQRSAVLALSPTDATAVRFESLFPSQEVVDAFGGTNADMLFAAEELLATALQLLQEDSRYRVALMHPFPVRLLDESGLPVPSASGLQVIGLVNRLQMRGIEVLEWPTTLEAEVPGAIVDVRGDDQPLVWLVTSIVGASADNATRLSEMRKRVELLVEHGEAVLLCLSPSTMPAMGEVDVFAELLGGFGIEADSGTPLLQEFSTATGRVVRPSMRIRPVRGEHAITNAVANLTTSLAWAVPLRAVETAEGSAVSVLEIAASGDVWGESEWLPFWALPQGQREQLRNPPERGGAGDGDDGPWSVAMAAEKAGLGGEGLQRMLVVGASGWIFDGFTQRARTVDGRTVQISPGNLELLDAGLAWLAQKDDLIAPGARVGDVPRIAAMGAAQLSALRWGIIAGLPVLVLVLGVSVRLIRG